MPLDDSSLMDLYEIMMRREVDPRFESDRFADLSDRELREMIENATEDEEGVDLSEIESFRSRIRR